MPKAKRDWADEQAQELVTAYGCFPQQGADDQGEARTVRIIAEALRKAAKRSAQPKLKG
jgi:hypothetical protein